MREIYHFEALQLGQALGHRFHVAIARVDLFEIFEVFDLLRQFQSRVVHDVQLFEIFQCAYRRGKFLDSGAVESDDVQFLHLAEVFGQLTDRGHGAVEGLKVGQVSEGFWEL